MPIPDNYKAPVKQSARDKAYAQIQEWIIDGTFLPGEKILDSEISKALDISRTPVREALQLLNAQGFVDMHPGRDTVVADMAQDDIKNVILPLACMERLSVGICAQNVPENLLGELKMINHYLATRLDRADIKESLKLDGTFHLKIAYATGNRYIWDTVSMLRAHIRRYFYQNGIPFPKTSVVDHENIIAAIEAGDSAKAEQLTSESWDRIMAELGL